jgi:acyl dehydratase
MNDFEAGQRVTVFTYDGRLVGDGTISQREHGHPGVRWVRMTIAGETTTTEQSLTRLRSRS